MTKLFQALIIALCTLLVTCRSDWIPPSYTIDMSLPASERWQQPCEDLKNVAILLYDEIINAFPTDMADTLRATLTDWYYHSVYEPYKSEIEYFSQCTGVDIGTVITTNLLYDLTAFCTSIVAENMDGTILHGRNLDYNLPILRNATITVSMVDKNGGLIYHGTTFFGYVGMWTGCKPDAFSLSGDERDKGDVLDNLDSIRYDYKPVGWLMRDVLQNSTDFNDALTVLRDTPLMAPVYYILGGMTYPEGAVITRNQTNAVDVWKLEDSEYNWYLVETNYDHWTPAPTSDDRRDVAIKAMDQTGQSNITATTMYDVLSTVNVLNNRTLYTTIMSASNASLYRNVVRLFPF